MSGKKPHLNPLQSRKQLLIAESELNRAQLVQEWRAIKAEIRVVTDHAATIRSVVSAAAVLVAGLVSFRRARAAPTDGKLSWWQTCLKGAQLAESLWSKFRPRSRDQDGI